MGKTRDLFKKIRDTKEVFHAKMGTIKDRNGKDLTEAEYIRKRWQEYIEKLYRNSLITQITILSFCISFSWDGFDHHLLHNVTYLCP